MLKKYRTTNYKLTPIKKFMFDVEFLFNQTMEAKLLKDQKLLPIDLSTRVRKVTIPRITAEPEKMDNVGPFGATIIKNFDIESISLEMAVDQKMVTERFYYFLLGNIVAVTQQSGVRVGSKNVRGNYEFDIRVNIYPEGRETPIASYIYYDCVFTNIEGSDFTYSEKENAENVNFTFAVNGGLDIEIDDNVMKPANQDLFSQERLTFFTLMASDFAANLSAREVSKASEREQSNIDIQNSNIRE